MQYKIAYLTSKNPADKKESSGVYYYQSIALEKHCGEIHHLGPVNSIIITIIIKASRILKRISKKKYNADHSILIAKVYARIFSKKLKQGDYDFVYADKSSCEIAYLKTKIPLIYSTDATFKLVHNYYPEYSNIFGFSIKESNIIEQKAIKNASIIICTSQWAASSVINDYHYSPEQIFIRPRGANIDKVPDWEIISNKNKTDICRLLFIGQEWYRKGYDIAYRTMTYIRSKGIAVKLVAIGCSPPEEFIDEDVELIHYVDKNTKEGIEHFDKIMLNSDFMLLPTRAECVAIAFNESSAYGLPVITRDTGGVTEVVKDGINGYALRYESDFIAYGDMIIDIFNSDEKYYSLIKSSRKYYESRLNWDIWGESMKKIFDDLYPGGTAGTGRET